MATFDADLLDDVVTFAGAAARTVRDSLDRAPRLHLSTAAASTLVVHVDDPDHTLREEYSTLTATTAGARWRVAAVKRRNDGVTRLILEDTIVTRLRDAVATYTVPAGVTTLNELATRYAAEARVGLLVEPTRKTLTDAVWRTGDAWTASRDLADRGARWRYSDGTQLVIASPGWLLTQAATARTENAGGIGPIAYTLDRGLDHETAAADVDEDTWTPRPGEATTLTDMGAASGRWVVAAYTAVLGESQGRVTWTRPRSQ